MHEDLLKAFEHVTFLPVCILQIENIMHSKEHADCRRKIIQTVNNDFLFQYNSNVVRRFLITTHGNELPWSIVVSPNTISDTVVNIQTTWSTTTSQAHIKTSGKSTICNVTKHVSELNSIVHMT